MCKGSQTTTSTASSSPNPQAMQAYQNLLTNTQSLAQQPYNPYTPTAQQMTALNTGDLVAPINPQQYAGIADINQYAMSGEPLYQQAAGLLGGAAGPLNPTQIMSYYSPFQQNVVATTEEQMNQQNQMALNNIRGNAAAQGALGGDREGVAEAAYYQGVAPGQEQTIAGLENTGYGQAVNLAMQQYQQNPEAVAYGLGNTGAGMVNTALQGAGQVLGAGSLEQQTQQNYLNAIYQQYLAAQGYPFQVNQYAAGIDTGVGSQMGGTETGQTTAPAPSIFSSLAGLGTFGLGAASLYKAAGARGGRINGLRKAYQSGGSPLAYPLGGGFGQSGGAPYSGGQGYVSGLGITRGPGPPRPSFPRSPQQGQQQPSANSMFQQAQQMAGLFKNSSAAPASAEASADPASWTASGADLGTIGPGVGAADTGAAVADASAAAADAGVDVAAADVGASSAADLLPLLLLAKRGGRINRQMGGMTQMPGGMQLPNRNRIQLPMRAGLGMPSFVPQRRGLQSGGSPDDEGGVTYIPETFATPSNAEAVADSARQQQLDVQGYGLTPTPVQTTRMPASQVSSDVIPGDVVSAMIGGGDEGTVGPTPGEVPVAYEVPAGQRAETGAPSALRAVNQAAGLRPQQAGLRSSFVPDTAPPPLQTQSTYQPPAYQPPPRLPPSTRPTILPQQSSGKGLFGLSPEASYALMAAGLGMMASRSPFAAVGIGEGGLQGLQTYAGLKKGEVDIEMESRKLDQQAQQEADRLAHETAQLKETAGYHQQELELRKQQLEQENWAPFTDQFGKPHFYNKKTGEIRDYLPGQQKPPGGAPPAATPSTPAAPWGPTSAVPFTPSAKGGRIERQGGGPAEGDQAGADQPAPSWLSSVGAAQSSAPATQRYVPVPSSGPGSTVMVPRPRDEAVEPVTQKLRLDSSEMPQDDPPGAHPEVLDRLRAEGMDEGAVQRVRAIGQGRMNFLPSGTRNPLNQAIMNAAYEYNPQLGQNDYQNRLKTSNFFAVGTQGGGGQNIAAINTWGQHINDYLGLLKKLDLGDYTQKNDIMNALARRGYGSKETQDIIYQLDSAQKAAADEGAKVFAGSGSALGDREEWLSRMPTNVPFHVALANIKELENLVEGRLTSLTHMYNEGMHTAYGNHDFMAPRTRQVIESIQSAGDPNKYTPLSHYDLQSPGAKAGVDRVDPRDAQWLHDKANNPEAAKVIDNKYGAGTAARLLGQQ